MRLIGNDGVIVSKVVKNDGKTYYILSDGVEFCYDETNRKLIGTDGTEYIIDEDNGKLICNNGNDAYIVQNNASNNDLANNISNIFKGNAVSQSVSITDISSVEHTLDVMVRSKNIFPFDKTKCSAQNATVISSAANEFILKGNDGASSNAYSSGWFYFYQPYKYPNVIFDKDMITISLEITLVEQGIHGANFKISAKDSKIEDSYPHVLRGTATTTPTRYSITLPVSQLPDEGFYVALNANTLKIANVQIEYGEAVTSYTPCITDVSAVAVKVTRADGSIEEYTPNVDGSVEGVSSSYPLMSLQAMNEGVIVDVTYNKDINKAFEDISENVSIVFLDGKTYCLKNKTI